MTSARLVPASLALLTLLAAGCGRARARDCASLDASINAGVARLEAHETERRQSNGGGPSATARDMRKAATLHRQTLAEIKALPLSDPEIKTLGGDYVAALDSIAGSADALATALEQDRRSDALDSDHIYASMLERQKRVVERLNSACAR